MRLYNALCAWIEATAFEKLAGAGAEEPHPEGNVFAQAEHAHSFSTEPELHNGWRPSHIDWDDRTHISLRWSPRKEPSEDHRSPDPGSRAEPRG